MRSALAFGAVAAIFLTWSVRAGRADDTAVPEAAKKWSWSDKDESLAERAKKLFSDLDVAVLGSGGSLIDDRFVCVKKGEKVLLDITCHPGTPIVREKDIVFVAEFNPISDGCSVTAYDLAKPGKVWHTTLDAVGPVAHSKYRNQVQMEVMKGVLVVRGWESHGRYIECLSTATGRQLWHQKQDGR